MVLFSLQQVVYIEWKHTGEDIYHLKTTINYQMNIIL